MSPSPDSLNDTPAAPLPITREELAEYLEGAKARAFTVLTLRRTLVQVDAEFLAFVRGAPDAARELVNQSGDLQRHFLECAEMIGAATTKLRDAIARVAGEGQPGA